MLEIVAVSVNIDSLIVSNTNANVIAKLPDDICINNYLTGLPISCLNWTWTPYSTGIASLSIDNGYGSNVMIRLSQKPPADPNHTNMIFRGIYYVPRCFILVK